jgi:hypothetical protein
MKDDAFRVMTSTPEGRMATFTPAKNPEGIFAVGEYTDKPNYTILNLKTYAEIPAFIQVLVDEYSAQYPEHNIEIRLAPKKE